MCMGMMFHGVMLLTMGAGFDLEPRVAPPVHVMTRSDIEESEALQKARVARYEAGLPSEPVQMEEDEQANFDAYMARIQADMHSVRKSLSAAKPAPNEKDATALVNLLYEDMTAPYLNARWQDMVVSEIQFAAARLDLTEEVAEVLREGLLSYAATGGGLAGPATEMNLATALTILGGPAHPECDAQAARLIEHAQSHAADLQPSFYSSLIEGRLNAIRDITRRKSRSSIERQKAQNQAERLLRLLSVGDELPLDAVDRVALLATVNFGDAATNEDMIARLLIAYRLRLENHKGLKKPVIAAIDNRLLWLADKKTRKLTSKRHWTLWPKAVGAIPRRVVSHDLHGFLRKSEKAKEDRSLAKATADAQSRLRRQ